MHWLSFALLLLQNMPGERLDKATSGPMLYSTRRTHWYIHFTIFVTQHRRTNRYERVRQPPSRAKFHAQVAGLRFQQAARTRLGTAEVLHARKTRRTVCYKLRFHIRSCRRQRGRCRLIQRWTIYITLERLERQSQTNWRTGYHRRRDNKVEG